MGLIVIDSEACQIVRGRVCDPWSLYCGPFAPYFHRNAPKFMHAHPSHAHLNLELPDCYDALFSGFLRRFYRAYHPCCGR